MEEWIFDKEDYSNYKNVLKNIEIEDQKKWDKRWLNLFINLDESNLTLFAKTLGGLYEQREFAKSNMKMIDLLIESAKNNLKY